MKDTFDKIRQWGEVRDLYTESDAAAQYAKLLEEVGELGEALMNRDDMNVADAIGDCVVVLTHIARFNVCSIENCIETALEQITPRKGLIVNRKFVKYENLTDEQRATLDARLSNV